MAKTSLIKLINLAIMMLCAMVGVGFVSGAEIYEFYARFKGCSFIGIIVFFILMFLLVYKNICENKNKKTEIYSVF